MPTPETVDIAVPGSTLRADRWPAAAPTVVMLHSGVTDRRSWYAVADALEDVADVIAYDRRGYGTTDVGELDFRHVDDLRMVIDRLTTGPVVLVGNSMGGRIALDFALSHPELVTGLILLAPAVSGAPEPTELDAATLVLDERLDRAWADEDKTEVVRLETWLWLDGPAQPEGRVFDKTRALVLEMNAIALRSGMPEGAGKSDVDAWSRLAQVRVPVTVGCGDLDAPFLVERCKELVRRLPKATHRTIDGVAHLSELERPATVCALLDDLLGLA
jgi:pimeloyl-ACP methyl ester carboxylesterase